VAEGQLGSTLPGLPEQAGERPDQSEGVSPGLPASAPLAEESSLIPSAKPAPSSLPAGPEAGAQAETSWCSNCKAERTFYGRGQCSVCHCFVKNSHGAKKHPINVQRCEKYYAELVAEYQPDSLYLRDTCNKLAKTKERLEHARDGSPEWKGLSAERKDLYEVLNAARRARLVDEPKEILTIRRVLVRGDGVEAPIPQYGPSDKQERTLETTARESTTPTVCRYCDKTTAACDELKESRPEAWRALHFLDPEEVKRRDQLATREMHESLRRQRTGGDPNFR
jgi:hypothetical protein